MEKKQQMRFSDKELSVIKNTFADNDVLLKAIRKVFLQIELSISEANLISNISKKPALVALLRKTFLPTIDGDAPFHQVIDLWMTLEIKGKEVDTVYHDAIAREKLIRYLDERLTFLSGIPTENKIEFASLADITSKDPLSVYVDLTVRNTIVSHTEMQLNQFIILAGAKEESVEETKDRLFKDSSK